MSFLMGWEILWPLVLGFALSGVVQAVVTKGEMSRLLPDSSARTILIATGAGYVVELIFGVLGLVPGERRMQIAKLGATWNYTTVLNILALAVSAVLVWRFLRTGGPDMLRMMGSDGKSGQHDDHTRHHETR